MTIVIRPAKAADLPAILKIYNEAVANTTAIWNDTRVDLEERGRWFAERREKGLPILVADRVKDEMATEDGPTGVVGYGSFGPFRPFEGFRLTVEHSVYVHPGARGRGVGRGLLEALVDEASARGYHAMVGAIDATNATSLALHRALGFAECGRLPEVGIKFGRYLDLVFMVRLIG